MMAICCALRAGRFLSAVSLLALILLGCQSPSGDVPVEIVWQDHDSRLDHPRNFTIRDEGIWRMFWQSMVARDNIPRAPERPKVDFAKSMLVAVYLGPRPYGGFEVAIESVRQEGDRLVVNYRELQPGPDGVHPQRITSPLCVAKIPYSDKRVEFVALPPQVVQPR